MIRGPSFASGFDANKIMPVDRFGFMEEVVSNGNDSESFAL